MQETKTTEFKPYVPADDTTVREFTFRAIFLGAVFGILFGAATVYLALKAGLTVSASIPIAVIAISLGRRFLKTSILENNIIQTAGSAGESVAAGVVFTLPAFLFLSDGVGKGYFNYWTILMLAIFGGILGVLMMIPLRRSLIVKEHGNLPYPEGTACAQVLIAGEKGGDFARTAYLGLGFAFVYATLQRIFHFIAEVPAYTIAATNKYLPAARVSGEITPEYLGVGYIIGPRIAGVLVAGGVLAWMGLIPLLATLVPAETIAAQLAKLDLLKGIAQADGTVVYPFGWDPYAHTFADMTGAVYRAYVRQIGAGAVAGAGFITLVKTLPTIVSSFQESFGALRNRAGAGNILRTENDLSLKVVGLGSLALVLLMAVLPNIPGEGLGSKLLLGLLVIVFGFFFVTVSSRIVGIIGSSNNPISGMTIATIMGTALVFIGVGWTGTVYEPMALVVGSMICVAAANAGATSQDLKTGYLVGATPRYQQIALFIGVVASSLIIGFTVQYLDNPTAELRAMGIEHAIGNKFDAPQATLMATLIKGMLSFNLDWQFVLVGVFVAITLELCSVKSLSFAVGLYLPLSTTLPIWIGGALKGLTDWIAKRRGEDAEDAELGKGSLFATGLVAGGALMGLVIALWQAKEASYPAGQGWLAQVNLEGTFSRLIGGHGIFQALGVVCFGLLAWALVRVATRR
ncbi:MAG: oligopeptide transporter, OPT family [Saprospirales bacterium]|nr:oligopeptide transporter, OPT family [Saprospirales bacterium]MBK8923170.1 oligopeptide transporter, OPT family [Saprospirales bacterium]